VGVVGLDLGLDRLSLKDPLDAQHLLDLILDGEPVLEMEAHVRPDTQNALALVRHHIGAEARALDGVLLEAQEIGAR